MRISRNFSTEELCHSDTAERYGIPNQITTFEQREALFSLVRKVLQPLKDLWGKPIRISGGFRCPALNERMGETEPNQYMLGEAVDIDMEGMEATYEMARLIHDTPELWAEIDQLIVNSTNLTLSHRRVGKQRQQLLYNKTYKGKRL